jgi:acyl dehydratase
VSVETHSVPWPDAWLVQPGAVYASQTLKFAAPVYVGDEVVARVQALHIRTTTAANSSTASRYVYVLGCSLARPFALIVASAYLT